MNSQFAAVDFLFSTKEDNVDVYNKIKKIKGELGRLDSIYEQRFWILAYMSASLFISGIVAFFLEPSQKPCVLIPNFLFVIVVFINLIKTYNLEKGYTKNIRDAMEKL